MIALHRIAAGSLLVLTLGASASAAPAPPRKPAAVRSNPSPVPSVSAPFAADTLYAAHARRLVQGYLRLKLFELRTAELEHARSVIERRLGADSLFSASERVQWKGLEASPPGWNDTRGPAR